MKRRNFIKLSIATCGALCLPTTISAARLNVGEIDFSHANYTSNAAQTIVVFLYGGASQLAGNLTNINEIKQKSQSSYDSYFRGITQTKNGFWKEAGGDALEQLVDNGDMTLFRCCYSERREREGNKAHGVCVSQNQRGSFDDNASGIMTNLAQIFQANNIVNENTLMPFVTMEGESQFYSDGSSPIPKYLKPVGIEENFENPYKRNMLRRWFYYTDTERESAPNNYWKDDKEGGFDPKLDKRIDALAQRVNKEGKIKSAFHKRVDLNTFIASISALPTPDLGADAYPENNPFGEKLKGAIKILTRNPETKIVTIGTGGLGGWDDHNEGRDYVKRSEDLFIALKSAMAHLKAVNKEQNVNIMVFGDFGRNVNLNSANGWDHGNLQNLYVLGGKGYFNHKGVVGETVIDANGQVNRLYLKPKSGSYQFEPLSIAATLYKIYGINNPQILTDNNGPIDQLLS